MKKILLTTLLSLMVSYPLIARKTERYGNITIGTHYDDVDSHRKALRFQKGNRYHEMAGVTENTIVLIEL